MHRAEDSRHRTEAPKLDLRQLKVAAFLYRLRAYSLVHVYFCMRVTEDNNPRTPGGFGRTPTPGGGGGVDFPPPPYDLEN